MVAVYKYTRAYPHTASYAAGPLLYCAPSDTYKWANICATTCITPSKSYHIHRSSHPTHSITNIVYSVPVRSSIPHNLLIMRVRPISRQPSWLFLLLCCLLAISWLERHTAQAHIDIAWADNSTSSFPTMDFPNHRVPYYEKQGTLIYWRMRHSICACRRMSDEARDMLKEHLANTSAEQDVAILIDEDSMYPADCRTVIQVSIGCSYVRINAVVLGYVQTACVNMLHTRLFKP